MSSPDKATSRAGTGLGLTLAGISLLLAAGPAGAGEGWETKRYGLPGSVVPWNHPEYSGYNEPTLPSEEPPPTVSAEPEKYTVTVTLLPHKPKGLAENKTVILAHIPKHARIWFDGAPTTAVGKDRYFETPPLEPGKLYSYIARIVWFENGKWVHKTEKVRFGANEMHCIYLSTPRDKDRIAANLARLSPEDRKLAEAQKYCVIEEGSPLGSMGVPVKIMLKDEPVFLCCKGCVKAAKKDPEKTLAKVKALKEKKVGS